MRQGRACACRVVGPNFVGAKSPNRLARLRLSALLSRHQGADDKGDAHVSEFCRGVPGGGNSEEGEGNPGCGAQRDEEAIS